MYTIDKEAARDRYGKTLIEIARQDENVFAMDCDLGRSTRAFRITEADPERFIEMGIAEQDMISTAAGMAVEGRTVFVNSFAIFITGRSFDQIRQQVCLPNLNVKVCGSSSGITQGPDGATHQSILDCSLMRSLPNMTVLVPADGNQTEQAVMAAYENPGPFYLRLSRYETEPLIPEDIKYELGKAQILKKGSDILFISSGPVLKHVLEASEELDNKGISTGIVNVHTLKPFDNERIISLSENYPLIITVEEHSIIGGLGSAAAEAIAEGSGKARAQLFRLGVMDTFGESGTAEELLKKHSLDSGGIVQFAQKIQREL